MKEWRAVCKYVFSFSGIVDLLSFLPYYLPVFFPSGAVAFRMFRVVRIFRLFRINAYYDSLNVITQVLAEQGPAAALLRVHHTGADDCLQPVYVLIGA